MLAVEAKNLSVSLNGQPVLEDINCRVNEGDFLAIVGPNGGGKTTFLRTILGLIEPDAGSLHICDRPPGRVPAEWIGYVPQIKTLDRSFPAPVIDLVVSGIRHRWPGRIKKRERQAAMDALKQVDVDHLAGHMLASLSGGELQRAYLAFSLVRKPRLIIMDEPATGIDAVGQRGLYIILEEYRSENGATIIMVTHDWGVALHHAAQVMVLNRSVVSFGPPADALRDEYLQKAYSHMGHGMMSPLHDEGASDH